MVFLFQIIILLLVLVLGIEPRALDMPGNPSNTELCTQTQTIIFLMPVGPLIVGRPKS